jgi:hypothetical protein
MTDRLQGHQFATDEQLRVVYERSMAVADLYATPTPQAPSADAGVTFTEAGLRQIAAEHLVALQLSGDFGIYQTYDDKSICYAWDGNESASFEGQALIIYPPGAEQEFWQQSREVEVSNLLEPDDLTPEARLLGYLFNDTAERLGTDRMLHYEAMALTGIVNAVLSLDTARARAMISEQGGSE